MRVILDTDPGVDDALALLFALRSPEFDVLGVTTVAGNVRVELCARNARAVLGTAGAHDLRVYVGADRPLAGRLTTATYFHGADGLGGLALPDAPSLAGDLSAVDFLLQAAREAEEPLTVIALGPLTNLAETCRRDSGWAARIQRIFVMGGAVRVPGNVSPVAEANFYTDPEAAAIVLASGAPVTLVTLDVTMQSLLTAARWRELRDRVPPRDQFSSVAMQLLDYYVALAAPLGVAGVALHDPLAVGVALQPDLVRTERLAVAVECAGTYSRGQTVAWLDRRRERVVDRGDHDDVIGVEPVEGNVDVCLEVDAMQFVDLFLERVVGTAG